MQKSVKRFYLYPILKQNIVSRLDDENEYGLAPKMAEEAFKMKRMKAAIHLLPRQCSSAIMTFF
jgi:hypothetical protein